MEYNEVGYKNTQKVEHTRSEIHMMKDIRNGTHTDWGTNGVGLTLAEKYMVWNTHRVGHTRSETTHAEWNTHGGIQGGIQTEWGTEVGLFRSWILV